MFSVPLGIANEFGVSRRIARLALLEMQRLAFDAQIASGAFGRVPAREATATTAALEKQPIGSKPLSVERGPDARAFVQCHVVPRCVRHSRIRAERLPFSSVRTATLQSRGDEN